jgi:hypothetical protein
MVSRVTGGACALAGLPPARHSRGGVARSRELRAALNRDTGRQNSAADLIQDSGSADSVTRLKLRLECNLACKIPLNKSVMPIRTEFMSEDVVRVDGVAQHLWLTRGIYTFSLNAGTQVCGSLVVGESTHMQTQAILLRWVYGRSDELRFSGQKARTDLFLKIAGSVLFLLTLGRRLLRRA